MENEEGMSNISEKGLRSTDRRQYKHSEPAQDQQSRSSDSEQLEEDSPGFGGTLTAKDSGPPSSKKKRKRDTALEALHNNRSQRLRGCYNDDYRQLLNKEISRASKGIFNDESGPLYTSQLGASIWTSREKSILFNSLSRLGNADVAGAATAIKTKSEMEVRDYISLLQNGLLEAHLNLPRLEPVALADIPAAVELSDECCNKLDTAGEAIAWYQFRWEAKQEEAKYGAYWLLDRRIAEEIEAFLFLEQEMNHEDLEYASNGRSHQTEEGEAEEVQGQVHGNEDAEPEKDEDVHDDHVTGSTVLDAVPAARLLRLKQWIQLSESVFMNPGPPREADNWRSLADADGEPSILKTAFEDFHRLAVSVTQRLVQATIFQALSRFRASDRDRAQSRQLSVNKKDVLTAIEVLGMGVNSNRFWTEAARRCSLVVYRTVDDSRRGSSAEPLGYEIVEKLLKKEDLATSGASQAGNTANADPLPALAPQQTNTLGPESQKSGTNSESSGYSSANETGGSDLYVDGLDTVEIRGTLMDLSEAERNAGRYRKQHRNRRDNFRLEHEQDKHTEELDQRISLEEERRLMAMLRHEVHVEVKEEVESTLKKPLVQRKNETDLRDWRNWIDYQAAWEKPRNLRSGLAVIGDTSIGRTAHNTYRK